MLDFVEFFVNFLTNDVTSDEADVVAMQRVMFRRMRRLP